MIENHSLIERVLSGDEQAVAVFYQQYSPRIFRYLRNRVQAEDAEELLNDIFFEVIQRLPLLRKEETLPSYIFTIAHGRLVDFYRKKKLKTILLSSFPFLEIMAREIDQPDFQMEKNLIRDKIETALHSLSQKYQRILRLHYEDQIPIKMIALVFNISGKAAESLLFRARQDFKRAYERT